MLGLESDYNSFSRKDDKHDAFQLYLNDLIKTHIGDAYNALLTIKYPKINDKRICQIDVESDNEAAYLLIGKEEQFYIRSNASSRPLKAREQNKYIKKHEIVLICL